MKVVGLSGGVGGAKLSYGLYRNLPPGALTVIGNTGDDVNIQGLHVSPDLDTALYSLSGLADPVQGWGIAGDTYNALDQLARYGVEDWFKLGDRDLATHIYRSNLMRQGQTLTQVTMRLCERLNVAAKLLPMTDDPVRTIVITSDGPLEFQDYFVRRGYQDVVNAVDFVGATQAKAPVEVLESIASADVIVLCPSNPVVSLGPILAVPGIRQAIHESRAPKVAVSPIVGGTAVSGPAGSLMSGLGYEVSAVGVAQLYADFLTGMVIDTVDEAEQERVQALGVEVCVTDTMMTDQNKREQLAVRVLEFARELAARPRQGTR